MIMEIRDDGVTVVNVKNKEDELFIGITICEILKKVPTLSDLVVAVMSGKVNIADLGIDVNTTNLGKTEDQEKVIRRMQREQPAEDKDIPNFVKRSLHE